MSGQQYLLYMPETDDIVTIGESVHRGISRG